MESYGDKSRKEVLMSNKETTRNTEVIENEAAGEKAETSEGTGCACCRRPKPEAE